ncbi:TetR/AcrR family transcriptional regulator [Solimonas sp. K1W22B-7]|uniref:TetR/AcrR family transcriptional regulator n=1 Tax=Solimonas sp. K1W22B-7 TaxID=2303331 RepID=UPI0013C42C7C|nr:TetR/AcrR family transcriptional regulator [Solimonas sp. K1W22B-7]
MNDALDPLAVARQPTQQRARDRFDRILAEAEALLLEAGLSGFSVPVLAERLDYTRGSIYAYFPTPYAILNELVARYLVEIESQFRARADELRGMTLREAIAAVVDHSVSFYEANPVARLLILGGAVTDDSFRAQEMTIKHLGDLGRAVWTQKGVRLPNGPPDVTTLSVDIATACFRRSFFEHGSITPAYRDAAVAAMMNFLLPYVDTTPAPAVAARTKSKPRRKT